MRTPIESGTGPLLRLHAGQPTLLLAEVEPIDAQPGVDVGTGAHRVAPHVDL